jgi:hypothetical protein
MSATNPQEEKSKPVGLSNRVLFIDHNPTQYLLDIFDSETPMFTEGEGYYIYGDNTLPSSPKINKKADLFRFHIGKYYREFALTSVYGPQLKNQKLVLNTDGTWKGVTQQLPSAWAIKWSPKKDVGFGGNTMVNRQKITLVKQSDLTDYTSKRNFSPVNVTITKFPMATTHNGEDGFNQIILLDYYEDPDKADNTKISFSTAQAGPSLAWKDYVLGLSEQGLDFINLNKLNLGNSGTFTDHTFSYNFPITKPDLNGNNNSYKTLYASVQPEYNFYMKRYEEALASTNATIEQYLPNIYVFTDLFGKDSSELSWSTKNNTDYKQLLELEGLSETVYWYDQSDAGSGENGNVTETMDQANLWNQVLHGSSTDASENQDSGPSKNAINVGVSISNSFNGYLTKWSNLFQEKINDFLSSISNSGQVPQHVFTRARNLVIPPYRNESLGKTENIKKLFPMATEIEFSTDSNTEFSQLLLQSNIWDNVLSEIIKIVEGQSDNPYKSEVLLNGFSQQSPVVFGENLFPQNQKITTDEFDLQKVNVFDIKKWLDETSQSSYQTLNNNSVVLDLDFVKKSGVAGYDYNALFNTLALKILKAKFNELRFKHRRSYQDIINGEKCYNETVFYRVEKIDPTSLEVIQNFYFVNSPDIDTIKYIDTQVFYDKRYEYRIYAWQLVLGSSYEYKDIYFSSDQPGLEDSERLGLDNIETTIHSNNYFAVVDLFMKDSAVLLEIPYYQPSEFRIIDDPPVAPEVEMIPYKNVGDKILMFLRPNVGEYKLPPRIIEEEDEAELEKLRQVRGYGPDDDVMYSTDDHVTTYEIYRTTKRPLSYQDFAGQRIVTVENETSFVDDTIQPNTKYYYVFRSVDVHGNKSIPSDVYELEMLQNLDAVYPTINIVSIDTYEQEQMEKTKKSTKSCRKYLYIKAPESQIGLSYEENEDLEEASQASEITPSLGFEDMGVLGKKFKIRLTSKKTGKRIDFNLDFRTSYDKTKIVNKNNQTP